MWFVKPRSPFMHNVCKIAFTFQLSHFHSITGEWMKAPNFLSAFTFIFSKGWYLDKINGCFDYLNLFNYSNELYVLVNTNSSVLQNIQFILTICPSVIMQLLLCSCFTPCLLSVKCRRGTRWMPAGNRDKGFSEYVNFCPSFIRSFVHS